MTDRSAYFLQVLEKIGTPLMSALAIKGEGADDTTAQSMAELLTKGVEASIALGPLVDLDKLGDKTDSVRVALAGLASEVLADFYYAKGTVPQANDLQKIQDGFAAVISFSENFTASPESTMRLETLKADGNAVDAPQSQIQYLASFIPVIQSVSDFSFGTPAPQLLTEIATRITAKAQELRKSQFGDSGNADADKQIERGLVRCLADLYAACHDAQTLSLSGGGDDQQGGTMDAVWSAFDSRVQILEALVQTIVPGGGSVSVAPAPETKDQVASSSTSPDMPSADEIPPAIETKAPPAATGSGAANPMGFFSKKPDNSGSDDDDNTTASTAPAPAKPPVPEQPAAPIPPVDTPPPPLPSADDSEDSDEGDTSEDSGNKGGGSSPMSFFKKSD